MDGGIITVPPLTLSGLLLIHSFKKIHASTFLFGLAENNILFVMRCAIWYHLHNLKNVKNTHGGVLILVKFQALASRHHF